MMQSQWERPAEVSVLLVEDNEVDAMAIRRAFQTHRIANPIVHVWDGLEALETLRSPDSGLGQQFMVLLDINMPRMDGLEFLKELRKDKALADTVVFVLTTSSRDEDIFAAYQKQIAGYMVKSQVGEDFIRLVSMLDNYWKVVMLPSRFGMGITPQEG